MAAFYRFIADLVVTLHVLYVGFVVVGLLAILLGRLLHWGWVRNFWFRAVHFLMIAVVVFESLLGIECPLTTLENSLRSSAGMTVQDGTFLGRMAHDLLFYSAPEWVFTIGYCVFGLIVAATLLWVPPYPPASWRPKWQKWVRSRSATRAQ